MKNRHYFWIAASVAITKDKRIRYRGAELKSVKDHKARIIVLRMKVATIEEMANLLIKARHQIALLNAITEPPFMAKIDRGCKLQSYLIP